MGINCEGRKSNGITLIGLVVTIVVLIILAGVSIAMLTGENGILSKANTAKEENEVGAEKEKIGVSATAAKIGNNGIIEITQDKLKEELDNQFEKDKTEIIDSGNGTYIVKVSNTNREYQIEDNNISLIEKVTDTTPGELAGEGSQNNPYLIESVEDLVWFANDVTNGNTYDGKYVNLKTSLNFNSDLSYVNSKRSNFCGYEGELKTALTTGEGFKGIGALSGTEETTSFHGVFDGNNNIIYNLYMDKDVTTLEQGYSIALFGKDLYGQVLNLGLSNVNCQIISIRWATVSGVAGVLVKYGYINNCFVTGNIKGISKGNNDIYATGIVSFNESIIENCYNKANIYCEVEDDESTAGCYCGGIASNNQNTIRNCYNTGKIEGIVKKGIGQVGGISRSISVNESSLENCYNMGEIKLTGKESSTLAAGGITGHFAEYKCTIKNVYNLGKVTLDSATSTYANCGGIIGCIESVNYPSTIKNAYNTGEIINGSNTENNIMIGEIFGRVWGGSNIFGNYYYLNTAKNLPFGKDHTAIATANKVSSEQLKSNEVLEVLNSENQVWKKDTSNINNGYPIFNWQ